MNAALLASIASPGATPGDKILNSFGQYSKNMEVIDNFEQSITSGIVKDKKAYYDGKIAGDASSMIVSAVEIDTGVSLAAGGCVVDVASAVGSETGVGAVALAGSLAVTAEGAVVAEWGLTTAASSMIYFSKDLTDFQSSGTEGTGNGVKVTNSDGQKVSVYRAGDDFTIKPGEIKIDKETGLVTDAKGVSINTDPNAVPIKYGEPNLIDSLPDGLKIIQRGKPGHYEIVPEYAMTQQEFR